MDTEAGKCNSAVTKVSDYCMTERSYTFWFSNVLLLMQGSGLGPGTYNLKNSTNEVLRHAVGKRGPYDVFTGSRSQPIQYGYFATPVSKTFKGKVQCIFIEPIFSFHYYLFFM